MSKLSIVLPVYDEEKNIGTLLNLILDCKNQICSEANLDALEIIAVDDGSRDKTASILRQYEDRVNVVTHESNMGYGAALKTGFETATGDYLSFLDADGTCNPHSFTILLKSLKDSKADIAVGSRMDKVKSEMPAVRWIGNKFFASILTFLSGKKVTDSASGMRVFKKEIIRKLYPLPDGLHFTPAMTTKALHEGFKIVEAAVPYAERGGKSKLSVVKDGLRFFKIILDTVLMYNPFKVFMLIGLLCILVSALLLIVPLYHILSPRDFIFSDYIYRSISALYFFAAGVQMILFGVLARFIVSAFFKRHESGKLIHWINRKFKIYDRIGYYGLMPVVLGIAINLVYAYKHFFGKGITLHWGYLLIAAGFIIVGLQMVITGILIKILKDISRHKLHQDSFPE